MFSHYLIVQYDGSGFAGWQRQARARTVQEELETALARIEARPVRVTGAGRTDAGVHALGQVASFELARRWDGGELTRAINANTPADVWVSDAGPAVSGFHARKHATSRTYRYVVGTDPASRSPFRAPFEWALAQALDPAALAGAAAPFEGEHDFRGYSTVDRTKRHYRCTLLRAEWRARESGEGFIFTIEADRFLHRMVRFLVGMMVDVARGRRSLDELAAQLTRTDNREASPPAPPEGLYFVSATYPQLQPGPE